MRLFFRLGLFILLTHAPFSTASAAVTREQCVNVDLSPRFGPIRNQGTSGSCFAFVAADLLGFHYKIAPPAQVSAVDVAITHAVTDPETLRSSAGRFSDPLDVDLINFSADHLGGLRRALDGESLWSRVFDGGSIAMAAMTYNHAGGMCLESRLPSQGKNDEDSREYLSVTSSEFVRQQTQNIVNQDCVPGSPNAFRSLMPAIEEVNNLVLAEYKKSADLKCETRTPAPFAHVVMASPPRGQDSSFTRMIATALSNSLPMGIGYDSSFMTEGPSAPQMPAEHAGIVVGMRWNSERAMCEFKIRDSYGARCARYHRVVRASCESGNLWIPDDQLNPRVVSVTGINP